MTKPSITSNFLWTSFFSLVSRVVLPLIFGIAVARILGPANIGTFAIVASFVTILDLFRDFGINQTFIVDASATDRRTRHYFGLTIHLGIITAILLILFRSPLSNFLNIEGYESAFILSGVAVIFISASTIPSGMLQKAGNFRDFGIWETISQFVSGLCCLAMASAGMGAWSLFLAQPVRPIITFIAFWRLTKPRYEAPSKEFIMSIASKCLAQFSNSLVSIIYTIGDTALIGRWFGSVSAGLYSTSFNLAMKPVELVSWPLIRTIVVPLSKERESPDRASSMFYRALRLLLLAVLPIFLLIGIFSNEILLILYGPQYSSGYQLLSILSVYLAFRSLGTVAGGFLTAMGRPGLSNYCWILAYVTAFIAFSVFYRNLTLESAVAFLTLGAIVAYGGTLCVASALWKPSHEAARRLILCLTALSCYVGSVLTIKFMVENPLQSIPLVIFGCSALYVSLVYRLFLGRWKLPVSKPEFVELWKSI